MKSISSHYRATRLILLLVMAVTAFSVAGVNRAVALPDGSGDAPRYFSISTNLVPWAGMHVNLAPEVQVSRHLTVQVPVLWCPWNISSHRSVKSFALRPECRRWFGGKAAGYGHFVGIHASVAWFNLRNGDNRYQWVGRPLLGIGASYGYALQLCERFGMEFTLGLGWVNMRYNRYYNIPDGALIDRSVTNYFGIDRIGVSLRYVIDLKSR